LYGRAESSPNLNAAALYWPPMSISLESLMRQQMTVERQTPLLTELLSFLLIGGTAAVSFVGVSAAAVAVFSSAPAWLVSALCYALYVIPVYLLHRRFTFRSDTAHAKALPRYVAVQLCGIALATGFSWVAYGIVGLPTVLAAMLVIGLTSGANFVVLRLWAFSHS
jgi:putative flippase GtrA